MSVTAQAQTNGANALGKLSTFFDNVDPTALFEPVSLASLGLPQTHLWLPPHIPPTQSFDNDYIEQAAEALMTFKLTPSENNDLANYMSNPQNNTWIRFFLKFDAPSRDLWINICKNMEVYIGLRRVCNTGCTHQHPPLT